MVNALEGAVSAVVALLAVPLDAADRSGVGRHHPRHHPASGAHGMGVHGADKPGSDYPCAHLVSHHFLRASATATMMKEADHDVPLLTPRPARIRPC